MLRMPGCGLEAADGEELARALVSRDSGAQGLKMTSWSVRPVHVAAR